MDRDALAAGLMQRNAPFVAQDGSNPMLAGRVPGASYNTPLHPLDEMAFRQWVTQNKVPFDPNAGASDYDMRGFYRGMQQGDPRATSAIDPNDSRLHYPDFWKTPAHETFSNESQWANPAAPQWTGDDKLVAPSGRVMFDDRQQRDALASALMK